MTQSVEDKKSSWASRQHRWRYYGYFGSIKMLSVQLPGLIEHELATDETKAQARKCLEELEKLTVLMCTRKDSKENL
jgi:hypothetical protein